MPIRLDPRTKKWFFRFTRKGKSYFCGGYRVAAQAKEAERQARDRAAQIGLYPEQAIRDLTFREVGNEFLENSKKHKRTWKNNVCHVAIPVQFFKDKSIRTITAQNVEACLHWIKSERRVGDVTLNHYLALTKSIFNWFRKANKYRGDSPACDLPMKQVPRGRVRFFYPYEEKILTPILARDTVLWPYYVVALLTGMRLGEIMNLRVADVSITARRLFTAHSKTGRSRYVPLSEVLVRFLEPLISGKKPDELVMPNVCRWCIKFHRKFNPNEFYAGVAQLVEHLFRKQVVVGSSPIPGFCFW